MRSLRFVVPVLIVALFTGCLLPRSTGSSSAAPSEARGSGHLAFHLVDAEATMKLIELQRDEPGWDPGVSGIPDFIPAGIIVAPYVVHNESGTLQLARYIAIYEDVAEHGLDGALIVDAEVGLQPLTNQPVIKLVLDREGSRRFADLTRSNVGESLALVLDGEIRTYAVIQEEISSGRFQVSGFDDEEAARIVAIIRGSE
jgi:preprotein translocase subunit SecD